MFHVLTDSEKKTWKIISSQCIRKWKLQRVWKLSRHYESFLVWIKVVSFWFVEIKLQWHGWNRPTGHSCEDRAKYPDLKTEVFSSDFQHFWELRILTKTKSALLSPARGSNVSIWYLKSCTSERVLQSKYCSIEFDHCGNFQAEMWDTCMCERRNKWLAPGERAAEGFACEQSGGTRVWL